MNAGILSHVNEDGCMFTVKIRTFRSKLANNYGKLSIDVAHTNHFSSILADREL